MTTNNDRIAGYCDEIDALTMKIREELAPAPEPPVTVLVPGDDLQAALDAGGAIELAPLACFHSPAGFSVATHETELAGSDDGNQLTSDNATTLVVQVGTSDVDIEHLSVFAASFHTGLRLGANDDKQTTREQAPRRIRLARVSSTGQRGKRAIEVNAAEVVISDCEIRDCYDPDKRDSQAIWIGNAPGPVTIENCYLEAASENILVGGDWMKIPNCRPTGITIRDCTLTKRNEWRGNSAIPVKNLLELKDGHDVLIERCALAHCWKSGQDGYAFMLTPASGGSLRNVVIRECTAEDVGGIVNITGTDAAAVNTERTQVTIVGGRFVATCATNGGRGCFALITRGPESVIIDGIEASVDGTMFVGIEDNAPVDLLRIVGSTWNYPKYGIRIGGQNHGDNSLGIVRTIQIEGNIITGAHSSFRERYPQNEYVGVYSSGEEA